MRAMAPLMGMPAGSLLSLSLECDDLHLLKTVAAQTDTVLVCPDASAVQEVAQKRLVRLQVQGLPPVFSDMGVVSLKGRSFSLIAQFAVDFLTELGKK
jgi:DNA-binding transcriptional LysR family regulator